MTEVLKGNTRSTWHERINPIATQITQEIREVNSNITSKRNYRVAQFTLFATIGAVIIATLAFNK